MADRKDTKLINAGRSKRYTGRLVNPAIHRASTITFDTIAELDDAGRNIHNGAEYYGRRGTKTTFAFNEAMANLDNAAGCYTYPCGTAALSASLSAFLSAGDHLLMVDSVYEPTRNYCHNTLARFGIKTTYYDPLITAEGLEALVQDNTRVIFLESPGSLTMEVQDVPALVSVAKAHDIITIIDNTWATPLNFRPLDFGVDVSVQSATKYINGHSDVMIGVACANERCWPTLREHSHEAGFCTSVDDVYTTLRGLRTLGVRLREHERNALQVAEWLNERPEIDHLRHPAFASCPGHELFERDFDGGNGLFSFVMKGGNKQAAAAMIDGLEHFKTGFSWGGYESLALAASHLASKRSATGWDAPGPLIRLHIGLEDPRDLIDDLAAGLDRFVRALAKDD